MIKRMIATVLSAALAISLFIIPVRAAVADSAKQHPTAKENAQIPVSCLPDAEGTVSFQNLDRRLEDNHSGILGLAESIRAIRAVDFDQMYENLRQELNAIAEAQWNMIESAPGGLGGVLAASLEPQFSALRDTFEDLKTGKLQKNYADAIWQLETAQNQILMAGESLYIQLVKLELEEKALCRALAAMDRSLQTMELRYELGQISAAALEQAKAERAAMAGRQKTLLGKLSNWKVRLEAMLGEEAAGSIALGAVPTVTTRQLSGLDLEADLLRGEKASYRLRDAQLQLDAARKTLNDYSPNESNYRYLSARNSWQAAQNHYDAEVQNFSDSFRSLSVQLQDARQVYDSAQTTLAAQRKQYDGMEKKYERGLISRNALWDAADLLAAAEDHAGSAAIDLFSSYRLYSWATRQGIL